MIEHRIARVDWNEKIVHCSCDATARIGEGGEELYETLHWLFEHLNFEHLNSEQSNTPAEVQKEGLFISWVNNTLYLQHCSIRIQRVSPRNYHASTLLASLLDTRLLGALPRDVPELGYLVLDALVKAVRENAQR